MTQERIKEIAEAVQKREKEISGLLDNPPEKVAEEITKIGFPITGAEFAEFCGMVADAQGAIREDGTLDDEALEKVSGGVFLAVVGIGVLTFGIFYGLGKYILSYR